jgi:predicted Ser/Thr protein kinase
VVKFALRSRASTSGKNPSWTSYEKIREVIEKRMFSQVEDLLPVISFGSKKDSDSSASTATSSIAWWNAATPSGRCAAWSSGTCA